LRGERFASAPELTGNGAGAACHDPVGPGVLHKGLAGLAIASHQRSSVDHFFQKCLGLFAQGLGMAFDKGRYNPFMPLSSLF